MDADKFQLTADSVDHIIYLVAKGTPEDLQPFVADPDRFVENRCSTVIVVLDETPLWLKLRGEEKVVESLAEVLQHDRPRD